MKNINELVIKTVKEYFKKSAMIKEYKNKEISTMSNEEIVNLLNEYLNINFSEWCDWLVAERKSEENIIKEVRRCSDYIDEFICSSVYSF